MLVGENKKPLLKGIFPVEAISQVDGFSEPHRRLNDFITATPEMTAPR